MKTLEDVLDEITPAPDPDFVADMEWRMRHGFPPARKPRLPRPSFLRLRPAMAVAASLLLAVLVAVSLVGSDGGEQPAPAPAADELGFGRMAEGASVGAIEPAMAPDTAVVDPAFPSPGGGGGIAPGADVRRIERTAQLTLAADPDDFDALAGSIFRTADRRDGFVLQSSFTQGEDGFSGGFFELRVPAQELQPALNELSRLATVRARSESGTDVTGSFVSTRDRLRTARALRTSLLAPPRAGNDRHRGRGPPQAARDRRQQDHRSPRASSAACASGPNTRPCSSSSWTRRRAPRPVRPTKRSTTPSAPSRTCSTS